MDAEQGMGWEKLPIPMSFGVFVKWCKHDWKDDVNVITNKVAEVFIIPKIQGTLGHLVEKLKQE